MGAKQSSSMAEAEDKTRALLEAARGGDLERVHRLVLSDGVSLNAKGWYGRTALMDASEYGNMDVVRFLVDRGADVAAVDTYGWTALMLASWYGKTDVVRFLVERDADVDAIAMFGKTALMLASEKGNMNVVRFLMERGTDVAAVDYNGKTSLMLASEYGKMDVVRVLVERGADVAAVDKYGKTAMMYASKEGNMDVVRFLVERGADVDAVKNDGVTALMFASKYGNMDIVRFLVERGADVAAIDNDVKTALMVASYEGNMDVVRFLVERGADMAAVDKNGRTALMVASEKGKMDVVRFLVERGADMAAVNKYGKTALMLAMEYRKLDVVWVLVEGGADVAAVYNDGRTSLMLASQYGNMDVVRVLVERGADVAAVDKNGLTALMHALQYGNMDVVRFLVERGADVAAVDKNGRTAMVHALQSGNMDVVRFLVERGADVAAVNKYGTTALMFASEVGNMDVVRFLVERGADVAAVDKNRRTALMYASKEGKMDVVRFLVEQGADVNVEDKAGHTAMFHCSSKGHDEIQRILIPLVQQRSIGSNFDEYQEPTTQSASSWFISPFEIELLNLIEREGVGVQFRAKWLDAEVAVKLFIPGASRSSFADEVTMWRHLRHPNVIKLYGACNVGHFFFVSELASNGSVVEHLAACRHKGIECTPWKFLHEAALGLAYLHERKMVHGDLRGSNILIGSDGLAKLSEFALCDSTRTSGLADSTEGGVFGSTRWQSPERVEGVEGGKATCASDVYSLGLCVVEVVSGEIPWKRKSDYRVMLWKKDWDPLREVRSSDAPGPLSDDDVITLVVKMCALDPAQRVTAAVAAQMLELLSTIENQAASQQPESEPQTSIDEYKGGELRRLWDNMQARMSTSGADTIQRKACEEIQAMYEPLRRTNQPWNVVYQFHRLLVDIDSMLRTDSYENQIQRLSSTRATGFAMDAIRRRLDALWVLIDGSQSSSRESQKQRWRQERAKQLDLFVSEVEQTLLVLNELETEEDRVALLAILKLEKDNPMSKYTPSQLSVIEKAYNDLVQQMQQKQYVTMSDAVTMTPEWFLPLYELEIDKLSCVGTGGFGCVCRARWLESEVVVKLLDQGGSDRMNDNSFASTVSSSYLAASQMTPTNPTTREERAKVREMFAREVGVWFGLSHPHVIRLFGACHVGTLFFACEFASNGSLDKYLRKHPDELWRKLYEGALGVQYLHSRGIVHGDLKCNNILVGSDGKAKVTDFGLSSDAAVLDKAGAQVSDAWQWVAPECLEHGSSRLSSASDVYSLGMCIVEALRVVEATTSTETERAIVPLPWGNLDNSVVLYHVVRKQALPLRPSVCTDEQWKLVTRMCAFKPSDRLNIGTVVDILGRFSGVDVPSDSEEEDAGTHAHAVRLEDISAAVAEMKSCIDTEQDAEPSNRTTLTQIFGLLWSRLDDLSRVLGDGSCADVERLCELVDRSRQSTMAMREQGSTESLIAFTETAIRGYALHRGLDKLMEANRWRVDSEEGGGVHDWRRRCNEFLAVTADMPSVNETVKALEALEVETGQTMLE